MQTIKAPVPRATPDPIEAATALLPEEPRPAEPPGPWWEAPGALPEGIWKAPNGRHVHAPDPSRWRHVDPHPLIPGHWAPAPDGPHFQRHDPVAGFWAFAADILDTRGRPVLHRPAARTPEQGELERLAGEYPALAARLAALLGIDPPASRREGDLIEIGLLAVDRNIVRLFGPRDEYLARHARGDFGIHGLAGEIGEPTEFDRACPGLAPVGVRNLMALRAGEGVVHSTFVEQLPGRGRVEFHIQTLFGPGQPARSGMKLG